MTKRIRVVAGLALAGLLGVNMGALAQADAAPAAATNQSARITLLDKQTNRRSTLVLVAAQPQTVGSLTVKLTKCLPDYAARLGQDVAWLDITESEEGNGRSAAWFSGWMFNTYPEVSTLDHPRYDVILQGCGTKARKIVQTTASAPVLDESGPPLDTESAEDLNTTNGTDPFAVPGVKDESQPAPQAEVQPLAAPQDAEAPPATPPTPQPEAQPVAPVAPPVEPQAGPATEQQDLHNLMDGTY